MKKILALALLLVFAGVGFNGKNKGETLALAYGKYGVCSEYSQVSLRINADNTFTYCDNTTSQSLVVKGTWTRSGNTIKLKDTEGKAKIHDKWKIDGATGCLKARKGMEWRRLCLVEK